ncbi:MAG: hypothetical protein AB9869_21390 [Verrucomicrobiia bacterium]
MNAARIAAPLALAATFVPPILFAFKLIGEGTMKSILLIAAVVWFGTASFWLKGGGK